MLLNVVEIQNRSNFIIYVWIFENPRWYADILSSKMLMFWNNIFILLSVLSLRIGENVVFHVVRVSECGKLSAKSFLSFPKRSPIFRMISVQDQNQLQLKYAMQVFVTLDHQHWKKRSLRRFPMHQHPKDWWQMTNFNRMAWLKQWPYSQAMEEAEVNPG